MNTNSRTGVKRRRRRTASGNGNTTNYNKPLRENAVGVAYGEYAVGQTLPSPDGNPDGNTLTGIRDGKNKNGTRRQEPRRQRGTRGRPGQERRRWRDAVDGKAPTATAGRGAVGEKPKQTRHSRPGQGIPSTNAVDGTPATQQMNNSQDPSGNAPEGSK